MEEPEAAGARRGPSIALRMTLWYAVFSFAMITAAAGILYWTLARGMYDEDLRDLADNLNNARLLLASAPSGWVLPQTAQRPPWAPRQQPQILLRVLDAAATTLTETPGMAQQLPPPTRGELAALPALGEDRHEVISHLGKPFLTLIVRVAGSSAAAAPQFIQVAMDRDHDELLLAHYREQVWLVFGLSLIGCSAAGYFIARTGMRPIERIGQTAARIRSTTLDERIETEGLSAELGVLADTFNEMLDRLEASFRHISQFSDDVAHELRTPLNNLRGEIEVALGKARSGEAYRDILGSCLEECTRLSRVIETLLLLARFDTTTGLIEREVIDIARELATVEAFYGAAAMDAGIVMQVSAGEGLSARVNRTLFQQAVGNLVSNAIAHTPAGGTITIGAGFAAGDLIVTVSDTGCGIAADHLSRVFERFYRVDPTRSGSTQHVGLGLAVVKSIATRHGGRVEITSELGNGTQVRLALPT